MLGDALSFPRRGDDWLKNIGIGGVLSLLGLFVPLIPILPVQGYFVRVLRSGIHEEAEPPAFDEWGDLFVDGILLLVVQLVYVLVPTLVLLFAAVFVGFGAFAAGGAGSDAGFAAVGLVGGLFLLVGVVGILVAAYLVPAAAANFAREGELGAAFDLSTVRRAAFTGEYFVAVLLAIAVGVVLGLVAAVLTVVLVGIFLGFYVQVVTYYLFGRGFAEGLGLEPTGGSGGTSDSADEGRDDAGGDDRIPDPDPLT